MNESTILEALKYFWALMDFGVIGIVLLSGYFAGRYLNQPAITKHIGTAWRTLIVSAVFVAIYVALLKKDGGTFVYTKLFVSYVTATSLYELIVKAIGNYLPSQLKINQMEHWQFETNGNPLGNVNDIVVSVGNQNFGVPASQMSGQTQGVYYIQNGYLCASLSAFQQPINAVISPVGGGATYIAGPIRKPK